MKIQILEWQGQILWDDQKKAVQLRHGSKTEGGL